MQYLGGKHRIAKDIGAIINRHRGDCPYWEPFCGALNVTAVLGPNGIASDRHAGLINLYKECLADRSLLDQLEHLNVTEQLYADAKTWHDDDPLKAFIGFGASFGGKWFGGLARPSADPNKYQQPYVSLAARGLKRKIVSASFQHLDFLNISPQPVPYVLYLDPPYRGTTGYKFGFDSDRFEALALQWSRYTDVFVSEYAFPHGVEIWSGKPSKTLSAGVNGSGNKGGIERLFYIPRAS